MTIYTKGNYGVEYAALKNAIARCTKTDHPQYKDYGGRGITVDAAFMCPITGFQLFMQDVGPKPSPELTLDRLDNSKGYAPGNLGWSTRAHQVANRRKISIKKDLGWGTGYVERKRIHWISGDSYMIPYASPLVPLGDRIQTLVEWADELGLSSTTLRQRFQRGWSPEKALTPALFNPKGSLRSN